MKKKIIISGQIKFFIISLSLCIISAIIKPEIIKTALRTFISIIIKIIPILILVFAIMLVMNYYITQKWLLKNFGNKAGAKVWFTAVITGIISSGPIYMWYPMLSELRDKGIREGAIATFLYARAIKPPLFPLMIHYFGLLYTIILSAVMVIFSIIQGKLIEKVGCAR